MHVLVSVTFLNIIMYGFSSSTDSSLANVYTNHSLYVALKFTCCTGGSPCKYSVGDEGFMSLSSNSQHGLHVLSPQEGVSMSFVLQARDTVSKIN